MLEIIIASVAIGASTYFGWKLHENYISKLVVKNLMDVLDKKKSIVGAGNVIHMVHRKKETQKG